MKSSLSLCKVADALDFFDTEIIECIFKVGEKPRLHLKQWEYAQILRGLIASGKYQNNSTMLGLGCGRESIIPILASGAKMVFVTDIYSSHSLWEEAKGDAAKNYATYENIEVITMDMRNISFQHSAFDFVWSICALEHIGTPDEILNTIHEVFRVLKPNGYFMFTTEFNLESEQDYTLGNVLFDGSLIERIFNETRFHSFLPIDFRISDHPMNIPLGQFTNNRYSATSHITRLLQNNRVATGISILLTKEESGNDYFIEDKEQFLRIENMKKIGMEMASKLDNVP